jgi:hypothetical protein
MDSGFAEAADNFKEHPWYPDRITNQNLIQKSSSRESSSYSASQQVSRLFSAVAQQPAVGSYPKPDESVHILTQYFIEINFNSILQSTPVSPK